jgi:ParB family chromosome partitioning protein
MAKKALGRGLGDLLSSETSYENDNNGIQEISISSIIPNSDQPRKTFNNVSLKDLADSIKNKGVLQPILVSPIKGNQYEILIGERRWKASKIAGLNTIPCIIKEYIENNVDKLEIALIENIQREDLNPIELANTYNELFNKLKITQEELSKRVGKSRTSIANTMRLLKLPKTIQQDLIDGNISEGHGRALLSIKDEEKIKYIRNIIIEEKLTVRDTEQIVQELLKDNDETILSNEQISLEKNSENDFPNHKKTTRNIYIDEQLSNIFETKVKIIRDTNYKGKLEIIINNKQHFEKMYDFILNVSRETK